MCVVISWIKYPTIHEHLLPKNFCLVPIILIFSVHVHIQEQLASCSVIFDGIVEQLPLYGPALAKIKVVCVVALSSCCVRCWVGLRDLVRLARALSHNGL